MHVDLPPLISVEATGVCIPIGNQENLQAAVYKSPWRTWTDADITELLSFRHKCTLAGDLNAKHPSWNSAVSNPSGHKLLQLFDRNDFEMSAPQYPTHYSPMGNGDVLDIVVHKNTRPSDVIVSDVLDSDRLPTMFHILDHVTTKQNSKPFEKFNFNNKMSTAAVFLDIEKAFNTTWHTGLLYKLAKLNFSTRMTKLINLFLLQRKFSLGKKRNVYAKVYESRAATRFRLVPHSIQTVQTVY
jgi:hypothetical protein